MQRIPRRTEIPRSFLWPERGNFKEPTAIRAGGVVIDDGDEVFFLRLRDGRLVWRISVTDPPAEPADDQSVVEDPADLGSSIRQVACGGDKVVVVGEDQVVAGYELGTGELAWEHPIEGVVLGSPFGAPTIRKDKVALGFEEPDQIQVRNLVDGELIHLTGLEPGISEIVSVFDSPPLFEIVHVEVR